MSDGWTVEIAEGDSGSTQRPDVLVGGEFEVILEPTDFTDEAAVIRFRNGMTITVSQHADDDRVLVTGHLYGKRAVSVGLDNVGHDDKTLGDHMSGVWFGPYR